MFPIIIFLKHKKKSLFNNPLLLLYKIIDNSFPFKYIPIEYFSYVVYLFEKYHSSPSIPMSPESN
jgi:hypothetical protein